MREAYCSMVKILEQVFWCIVTFIDTSIESSHTQVHKSRRTDLSYSYVAAAMRVFNYERVQHGTLQYDCLSVSCRASHPIVCS